MYHQLPELVHSRKWVYCYPYDRRDVFRTGIPMKNREIIVPIVLSYKNTPKRKSHNDIESDKELSSTRLWYPYMYLASPKYFFLSDKENTQQTFGHIKVTIEKPIHNNLLGLSPNSTDLRPDPHSICSINFFADS